jgi:hypothetical protein
MALQPAAHRPGQRLVVARQYAVGGLDDRYRGAELAECDPEFEPDIAGPDHDELFRHGAQRQRLGRGDHLAAKRQCRQRRRFRAGGENHVIGDDRHRSGIGGHGTVFRIGEPPPAPYDPHFGARQQALDAI